MTRHKTTDLDLIRSGQPFQWGQFVRLHEVGRYVVLEYLRDEFKDSAPTGRLEKTPSFHVYVDGDSTNHSTGSLESALILAIARGRMEVNTASSMAQAACKVLDVNDSN